MEILVKSAAVNATYGDIGHQLDAVEKIAWLADACYESLPVVGVSKGFCELTGNTVSHVLGQSLPDLVLCTEGLPRAAISRSAGQDLSDYCKACGRADVEFIGECEIIVLGARQDGSIFQGIVLSGLCLIQDRRFVLSVKHIFGDGLRGRLSVAQRLDALEELRKTFRQLRSQLHSQSAASACCRYGSLANNKIGTANSEAIEPYNPSYCPFDLPLQSHRKHMTTTPDSDFAFFTERLQHHCILSNGAHTAERREGHVVPNGCLVFSDRPLKVTPAGLCFCIRVDRIDDKFTGLPTLGFTRRRPVDEPGIFPTVTTCMGSSALVGAMGEAFTRDQHEHFKIGFKPPPQAEVHTTFEHQFFSHHDLKLCSGDILGCVYTCEGQLQLWKNGLLLLDFNIRKPIDNESDYYAVVDVSLSASCVTVLPGQVLHGIKRRISTSSSRGDSNSICYLSTAMGSSDGFSREHSIDSESTGATSNFELVLGFCDQEEIGNTLVAGTLAVDTCPTDRADSPIEKQPPMLRAGRPRARSILTCLGIGLIAHMWLQRIK